MWVILLVIALPVTYTIEIPNDVLLFCPDHNPQKSLQLNLLMGTWHIVEIVNHLPRRSHYNPTEIIMDSCPTLHLRQDDNSNVRITWREPSRTVYYHARPDTTAQGYWLSSGPHDEYQEHNHHYFKPTGTVEVMKAVNNHLVLTFCKSDHDRSQLFSAVLSRHRWLPRDDTASINSMLSRRNLDTVLIKRMCNGAATNTIAFSIMLIVTVSMFI